MMMIGALLQARPLSVENDMMPVVEFLRGQGLETSQVIQVGPTGKMIQQEEGGIGAGDKCCVSQRAAAARDAHCSAFPCHACLAFQASPFMAST
jgi:hypothetical protein